MRPKLNENKIIQSQIRIEKSTHKSTKNEKAISKRINKQIHSKSEQQAKIGISNTKKSKKMHFRAKNEIKRVVREVAIEFLHGVVKGVRRTAGEGQLRRSFLDDDSLLRAVGDSLIFPIHLRCAGGQFDKMLKSRLRPTSSAAATRKTAF